MLRAFIRGIDYITIKLKYHFIQPSIDQVISKINEYINSNNVEYIFVAIEDHEYYKMLEERYKNKVISYGDNYINRNRKIDYNSEVVTNNYVRNLEYLDKAAVLSKCENIICSKATGSIFSYSLRNIKTKYEYWLDLGKY